MFYSRYESLCNEIGISPSKAAQKNQISKTSVTRWKRGAAPSSDILNKLATYFNVSTDYLLGKTDIKNRPDTIFDIEPTKDEVEFIKQYRLADKEMQDAIRLLLKRGKQNP